MRTFNPTDDEIYQACFLTAKSENKGMPDDWCKQWADEHFDIYKKTILESNILHHLQYIKYPTFLNKYTAHKLAHELPIELHQNLNEWIDGKPISDIKYGELSLNDIMHTYSAMGRKVNFIDCCKDMILYANTGCTDVHVCFHLYEEM